MVQGIHFTSKQNIDELIRECASTLQRVAAYRLPPAVDRRLLWLSENKEVLSPAENDELLDDANWINFFRQDVPLETLVQRLNRRLK